jgi:hypothetical protein
VCAPESGDCFPSQPVAASTASLAWEESEAGDGRDRRWSSSRAPLPPAGQQLGGGPLGSPHRPKVDVLLDLPPDRDQQSPERLTSGMSGTPTAPRKIGSYVASRSTTCQRASLGRAPVRSPSPAEVGSIQAGPVQLTRRPPRSPRGSTSSPIPFHGNHSHPSCAYDAAPSDSSASTATTSTSTPNWSSI